MRRPTTRDTKVYPLIERFTPEQHEIVRRLTFDATDPFAHRTAHIAARAFCAMHVCPPVEGPKIVMVTDLGYPEGYLPPESFERAAKAVGVAEIVEGDRWRVEPDPRVKRAAEVRSRRAAIAVEIGTLIRERDALQDICPHVNKQHHPRGTAEDRPWDECPDCGKQWGG